MPGVDRPPSFRWRDCGLCQRSALALVALLLLLHGAYSLTPDLALAPRNLAFLAGSVLLVLLLGGTGCSGASCSPPTGRPPGPAHRTCWTRCFRP